MKIIIIPFLNIVCLKYCFSISNPSYLQMITDVVSSYEQPTAIVANVCWPTIHKTKLSKMLLKEGATNIRYLSENKRIDNFPSNNHLLFLIDIKCKFSRFLLNQASANKMFSKTYRWLVLGKTNATMEELADLDILVDSEFIIAEEQEKEDVLLQTAYKIQPKGDWIKEYYGTWTTDNRLNKSEDRSISNVMRRKNLRGNNITISIVITDNRTKAEYAELSNFFIDSVTKSSYQTITKLYDFLNATRVITFTETWGYLINGTWTGMIGEMATGKADLSGSYTFINKERMKIVEYITIPAATPQVRIVFRRPPLSYQYNLFVLPFTSNVWYCLGGFIIILIIILYINAKWDIKKYEQYNENAIDETCLRAAWNDIIIFILSAISQQGSANELKGSLGRLVMFIMFMAFLFLYTSYSASIVVLLQSTSDQIRTLSDFMNSKLELGVEDVEYNKYYFSAIYAPDPVRKAFYETKVAPRGSNPNYFSLEEGVRRIQTKPFAFAMNTGSGYKLVSEKFQEHEKCGLQEIDYVQASKPWFSGKRKSPYTEMYRVGFFRIEEHGLSDRNNRLIFAKKPSCTVTGGNFGSVNMVDFYPVLLMLLYGMILAFVLLVLEILLHRRQKKMKGNRQHKDFN